MTTPIANDDYSGLLKYVFFMVDGNTDVNTLRRAVNIFRIAQTVYDTANAYDLASVRAFAGGAGQMEEDSLLTEGLDQDASVTRQYEQRQRQLPNVFSVHDQLDGEIIDVEEAVRNRLQEKTKVQRQLKQYRVLRPSVEDAYLLALDYIEQDADRGLGLEITRMLRLGVLTREEMARYLRRHAVTRSCFSRCAGACFSRVDGCSRSRADTNIFAGKERYVHEQRLAEAMLKTLCTMSAPRDFWSEHVLNRMDNNTVDVLLRHQMLSPYLLDIPHLFDVYEMFGMNYAFVRLDDELTRLIKEGAPMNRPSAFELETELANGPPPPPPPPPAGGGGAGAGAGAGAGWPPFGGGGGGAGGMGPAFPHSTTGGDGGGFAPVSASSDSVYKMSAPQVYAMQEQREWERSKTRRLYLLDEEAKTVLKDLATIDADIGNIKFAILQAGMQEDDTASQNVRRETQPRLEILEVQKHQLKQKLEALKNEYQVVLNATRQEDLLRDASAPYAIDDFEDDDDDPGAPGVVTQLAPSIVTRFPGAVQPPGNPRRVSFAMQRLMGAVPAARAPQQ